MILKFSNCLRALSQITLLLSVAMFYTAEVWSDDGGRLDPVDRELPEFNLQALDGSAWSAGSLEGKPWVINFWATWCPPCIEEIPSMNAAWGVLKDKGVGMLAINAGEGAASVEAFLGKMSIDFPHVLGVTDSLPNWSVRALPTTLLVNAEGQVVYEALGPREWDNEALLERIQALLKNQG